MEEQNRVSNNDDNDIMIIRTITIIIILIAGSNTVDSLYSNLRRQKKKIAMRRN